MAFVAFWTFGSIVTPAHAHPQMMRQAPHGVVGDGRAPGFLALPPRGVDPRSLDAQAAASATVPNFSGIVTSPLDKKTYQYRMVGTAPTTKSSTTVTYVPIFIRFHGYGTVLDPTAAGCHDTKPISQRIAASPLLTSKAWTSNGVAVGTTQLTDAFQRANFWQYARGTNYHVLLAGAPAHVVDFTNMQYGTSKGVCSGSNHLVGFVDLPTFDTAVRSIISRYVAPNQMAMVIAYNVLFVCNGQTCAGGFHSAYGRSNGTQTYTVSSYFDYGTFPTNPSYADITVLSHEFGEWLDDPFVNNPTPAWHFAATSTCSSLLEVGDPLSGTQFAATSNGFTYHPQELAFFSWFYRTPPTGTGGRESFNGTFRTPQGACH